MGYILLGLIATVVVILFVELIIYVAEKLSITWKDEPHSVCPVQAEGFFLGYFFYFRSRYETSKIMFLEKEEDWDDQLIVKEYVLYRFRNLYAAGYIKHSKARRLIYWGCFKFLINRIIRNFKEAIWIKNQN